MILNLTKNKASWEQQAAGLVDLTNDEMDSLISMLTLEDDVLLASEANYKDQIIARVVGIVGLIWPYVVRADDERNYKASQLYLARQTYTAFNAVREPIFQALVDADWS